MPESWNGESVEKNFIMNTPHIDAVVFQADPAGVLRTVKDEVIAKTSRDGVYDNPVFTAEQVIRYFMQQQFFNDVQVTNPDVRALYAREGQTFDDRKGFFNVLKLAGYSYNDVLQWMEWYLDKSKGRYTNEFEERRIEQLIRNSFVEIYGNN
jgi:hypothetical protein